MLSSSIERAPVPVPGMIGLDQVAFEAPDLSSRQQIWHVTSKPMALSVTRCILFHALGD